MSYTRRSTRLKLCADWGWSTRRAGVQVDQLTISSDPPGCTLKLLARRSVYQCLLERHPRINPRDKGIERSRNLSSGGARGGGHPPLHEPILRSGIPSKYPGGSRSVLTQRRGTNDTTRGQTRWDRPPRGYGINLRPRILPTKYGVLVPMTCAKGSVSTRAAMVSTPLSSLRSGTNVTPDTTNQRPCWSQCCGAVRKAEARCCAAEESLGGECIAPWR